MQSSSGRSDRVKPSAQVVDAAAMLMVLGFAPEIAQHLACLAPNFSKQDAERPGAGAATSREARQRLAERADSAVMVSRWCEAELLSTARDMTIAAGEALLLPELGVASVAELSESQAKRWRACAKSAVASELNALAGWGIQSCHDRVGLSLAPKPIADRVIGSLRGGWNDSRASLDFWRKVRGFSVDSATQIADAALGPCSDGDGQPVRPSRAEFAEGLTRSIIAIEGRSTHARKRRHQRLAERDTQTAIDDDGVGVLTATGGAASVAAAALRVDTIARKARAAGDARTIAQIRSDLTLALIIHGTLPDVPGARESVVGHGRDDLAEVGPLVRAALGRHAAAIRLEVVVPLSALIDPSSAQTAHVPGLGSITAEHARELALTPGATIHRLLTDPADGRCVERSISSYLPDQEMLDQIRAVDRTCRGPGCTRDARHCQPDHEQSHADGGATSETNLVLKHSFHHNNKTLKLWESELRPDRRVTWETLFGQKYVTSPFDYRLLEPDQAHSRDSASSLSAAEPSEGQHAVLGEHEAPPSDREVYLALAELWRDGAITPMSDESDDAETAELISLRHHTRGGAIRPGPSPEVLAARPPDTTSRREIDPADDPPPF
ncbi:HNH endonuclease [Ornithinimicrobium sp. Arc0846-15]|nr:HNH endonuclease [Ornithinimicrobium laminariae]